MTAPALEVAAQPAQDHVSPSAPPGMGPALSAAVRGALLRCAADFSSIQDQVDCAQLLCAAGLAEGARTLCQLAFVRMGFSPPRLREQFEVAGGMGLPWEPCGLDEDAPAVPSAPVRSLDAAVAQLRCTMQAVTDLPPLPASGTGIAGAFARGVDVPPTTGAGPTKPSPDGVAEACGNLFDCLRQPGAAATAEVSRLLEQLRDDLLAWPAFDARNHVGAPLAPLCGGVASDGFRHFLRTNGDLAYGPFGSPGLLHAAARLDVAGLGPYFSCTANLLRESRDLLGLVRLAGGAERDAVERWCFLLSQHLPEPVLHDLVQDLADFGLVRAIWGIYLRAVRQDRVPLAVLHAVRDAGLDNGDMELALRAQRSVAHWQPKSGVDWVVLGDVEATAGNWQEAERALRTCLGLDPRHPGTAQRLRALREGQYGPYLVTGGLGTPNSRKLLRLRRREAEERAVPAA